jgi:hypothetical protein
VTKERPTVYVLVWRLAIHLFELTLIRNAVKSMHVPSTFLFHVLLIGVHWNMLIRKAEPYAPTITTMVPQIATLVTLMTGSLEVEHIARYSKHNESLHKGVVIL